MVKSSEKEQLQSLMLYFISNHESFIIISVFVIVDENSYTFGYPSGKIKGITFKTIEPNVDNFLAWLFFKKK
jgi:hypothetical protein